MAQIKLTQQANRERAQAVFAILRETYPEARCSLDFKKPLELLISTILAAQCTDARVNIVTKDLFRRYKTPEDYATAPQAELEEAVRTCGFYRQKAKSIQAVCRALIERYDGQVPGTMEDLLTLDGVGRKTANVVLGECFGVPGVVVDTHCKRCSNRLGFTKHDDPVKIEQDLMKIWPREHWTEYSHTFVFHGRGYCTARGPRCSACPVRHLCPFPTTAKGKKEAK